MEVIFLEVSKTLNRLFFKHFLFTACLLFYNEGKKTQNEEKPINEQMRPNLCLPPVLRGGLHASSSLSMESSIGLYRELDEACSPPDNTPTNLVITCGSEEGRLKSHVCQTQASTYISIVEYGCSASDRLPGTTCPEGIYLIV